MGAGLGFLLGTSISFGLMVLYFRLDVSTLTRHDLVVFTVALTLPCAALWSRALTLRSLRIELDDRRITRIQSHPLTRSQQRISFCREDIAHIREVRKEGLIVYGRNSNGRYLDLYIPRSVENYDELRSRLAAWQPIHESWL